MSSLITSLNFNDLPNEVHHMTFDLFTPFQRAAILSVCKDWHRIIMDTQVWWREVEIKENASSEHMVRVLQVFSDRCNHSLTSIKVGRFIDTEDELEKIFSIIESSKSSIKQLKVLQESRLNKSTRRFAQTLPQIKVVVAQGELELIFGAYDCDLGSTGLKVFATEVLESVKVQELEWFSHLTTLAVQDALPNDPDLWLVLKSCKSTLESLDLFILSDTSQEDSGSSSHQEIRMDTLSSLTIFSVPVSEPQRINSINAPNLEFLFSGVDQARAVKATSLESLELIFDDEGEEGWNKEKELAFVEKIKNCLSEKPRVSLLEIRVNDDFKSQTQLKVLIESLVVQDQSPLCPQLELLRIRGSNQIEDMRPLALLLACRLDFLDSTSGSRFTLEMDPEDEQLQEQSMDRLTEAWEEVKKQMQQQSVSDE